MTPKKVFVAFVFLVGAVFIAAMAHEAVHMAQMAASPEAEPVGIGINPLPTLEDLSLAQVYWIWSENVTQEQAVSFIGNLGMWEVVAYAVFAVVFAGIIYMSRDSVWRLKKPRR